jgi:sortase A
MSTPVRTVDRVASTIGFAAVAAGIGVLLVVAYQIYGTDWINARTQQNLSKSLQNSWEAPEDREPAVAPGQPMARIYIPRFGNGWQATVVEGDDQTALARGPGHYPGTPLPGQPGNVAIAGHRVGRGAPFDQAGELQSCDAIVLEVRDTWFVYRVLPMADEVVSWTEGAGRRPECAGVAPLAGGYADTVGREIVLPSDIGVVAEVPDHPGLIPADPLPLLTLTTCNPRFSARQRMIIHAVLVRQQAKSKGTPIELNGT